MEAFPLTWPTAWPRTKYREDSRFKVSSFAVARDNLLHELELFHAADVILSTNIPLRRDGLPLSGFPRIQDPGVAVYFKKKIWPNGEMVLKNYVFACDKFNKIEDNIHAVGKTIEALRGIERWGSSQLLERAFQGFTALPAPAVKRSWNEVLGVRETDPVATIKERYYDLIFKHHPDKGGDAKLASEINAAFNEARTKRQF